MLVNGNLDGDFLPGFWENQQSNLTLNGAIDGDGVHSLPSPGREGLRDLECLITTFKHDGDKILPRGYDHLAGEGGFEIKLFTSLFQNDEMKVSIN
ncbi:MAG: hypothetical protein ACPGJR_03005 [Akkermansiaceae bacterium]